MGRGPVAILFVCTGNICRSPMAQGAAEAMADKLGRTLVFDSAGTGDWHEGEPPDARAIDTAARRGYAIAAQRARPVISEDFTRFDHLVGLDSSHRKWLVTARDARGLKDRPVSRLMDWSVGSAMHDVPDPYYGGPQDFEAALDLIERGVQGLLRRV